MNRLVDYDEVADRNRERINIIADERGGSQIRFLDRETWVKARLYLAEGGRGKGSRKCA